MSKFIKFEITQLPNKKTLNISIVSIFSGCELGQIKWYAPWRQYCFFPGTNTIFNNQCIDIINAKINHLNQTHKQEMKGR